MAAFFLNSDCNRYSGLTLYCCVALLFLCKPVFAQSQSSDFLTHLEFEDFHTADTASDSSLNGNSGVISGAEYNEATGDGSTYSMEFTGDDTIDLGGLDVVGTGLTLAAWINADTFPGNARDPRTCLLYTSPSPRDS